MVFYWQVRGDTIHTQFKKGVLELLVLSIVRDKDIYGYELVEKVREIVDVNEGTIYPILKRLTNEGYFETYLEESSEGPTRKYYHITVLGRQHQEEVLEEWNLFSEKIKKTCICQYKLEKTCIE